MTDLHKRILLFLIGCMGTRFTLVYLAYAFQNAPKLLSLLGIFMLLISVGMFTIYAKGLRKTGVEVFGDKIWWNDLRPVHATLYLVFALLALSSNNTYTQHAWKLLLLDTLIGLVAFLNHHGFIPQFITILNAQTAKN